MRIETAAKAFCTSGIGFGSVPGVFIEFVTTANKKRGTEKAMKGEGTRYLIDTAKTGGNKGYPILLVSMLIDKGSFRKMAITGL